MAGRRRRWWSWRRRCPRSRSGVRQSSRASRLHAARRDLGGGAVQRPRRVRGAVAKVTRRRTTPGPHRERDEGDRHGAEALRRRRPRRPSARQLVHEPDRHHVRRRRVLLPVPDAGDPARQAGARRLLRQRLPSGREPADGVFQVREGHIQLNHTYTHPHLNQLVDAAVIDEVHAHRAPVPARSARRSPSRASGRRSSKPTPATAALIRGLGYTLSLGAVQTNDWEPVCTGTRSRGDIVGAARGRLGRSCSMTGRTTAASAGSVEALGQIIDSHARAGSASASPITPARSSRAATSPRA